MLFSWLVLVAPLVDSLPDHPPEAVQDVALLEVHVNVELPPSGTRVGLAVSDTEGAEGAAGADIVTVAVCDADPPAPVQVSVKLIVVVRGDVVLDPLMGCVPLQPPEAVQDCAFVALHVKVTD